MTRLAQLRHQDEAFIDFHYRSGFFFGAIMGFLAGVIACSALAILVAIFWR